MWREFCKVRVINVTNQTDKLSGKTKIKRNKERIYYGLLTCLHLRVLQLVT